jgi:hypothetical protein
MQLPALGEEPSKEWMDEFKKLPLGERLDLTVQLAQRLGDIVSKTFPEAAASVAQASPVPASERFNHNVDAMVAAGDEQAAELFNVAMRLDPEGTLDRAEQDLASDTDSALQAQTLLQQMKNKETPQ